MGYSWAYELGTYDHRYSPVTGVIFQVKGCTRTVKHPDVMLVCWFPPNENIH